MSMIACACPDGVTPCTRAIQSAIDACHAAGGGRVLCPPGRFRTGSFELRSNVELHLTAGCTLVGSLDRADYQPLEAPGFRMALAAEGSALCLIRAVAAERIAITGPGVIDGSGPAFFADGVNSRGFFEKPSQPRPRLVQFFRCRDVRIEEGLVLKRVGGIRFTNVGIRGGLPCRVEGSAQTIVRDVVFDRVIVETPTGQVLTVRHGEGVRLNGALMDM